MPELLSQVEKKDLSWEEYPEQAFSEALARRFYGMHTTDLKCEGVTGLTKVGAHPLVSVVSGALLCISDGAILDLPPFSNFSLNASWIDDHLKYSLHRELRHLTSVDLTLAELSLSDAKLDDVMLAKARGRIDLPLPQYILENYLPTLLWGTIVDGWINPDPLLKCRPADLSPEDRERWIQLERTGHSKALLPSHLQVSLETGKFNNADRIRLRRLLNESALARITEVRKLWAQLTDAGHESFASVWAKGTVQQYFPNISQRAWGIAPTVPLTAAVNSEIQLNPFLRGDFNQIVEDALMYIDWTLNWPKIVSIIRSIEQGKVRTDMGWKPKD